MKRVLVVLLGSILILLAGCSWWSTAPVYVPVETPDSGGYAYNLLGETERQLYVSMVDALEHFTPTLDAFPEGTTEETLFRVNQYVLADHPEIFWSAADGTAYWNRDLQGNHVMISYSFDYSMSQEEALPLQEAIETRVSDIVSGIQATEDYEIALAVYEFVVHSCEYDDAAADAMREGGLDSDLYRVSHLTGALLDGKAICGGYARAVQYLLQQFGMEATYVTGGNHAWNLVRLDGEYYYVDATWGDPTLDGSDLQDHLTYSYFAMTTADLQRKYTLDADTLPLPECIATADNYFYRNGMVLETYSTSSVKRVLQSCLRQGVSCAYLKFLQEEEYIAAKADLFQEKEIIKVLDDAYGYTGNRDYTIVYLTDDDQLVLQIQLELS